MTRKKDAVAESVRDPWAEYQRVQLTPEQKAELRAEAWAAGDAARRNGVYERLLEMRGKIPMDVEFYRRLREDED